MGSRNSDSAGLFWLAVLALIVLYFLALILFAIAAFAALVMTVVALFAWNDDLRLGQLTVASDDARFFVIRGLIGAGLTPLFCAFMATLYDFEVDWQALPVFLLFGYTAGSVGIEVWLHRRRREEARYSAYRDLTMRRLEATSSRPALPAPAAYSAPPTPSPSNPPFRFASWDDEAGV